MAGFFKKLKERFTRKKVDWEELEEILVAGDLGIRTTMEIIDELQERGSVGADDVVDVCRSHISEILSPPPPEIEPFSDRPRVILVVGVNGVGKTTSVAKLAHHLQSQGHPTLIAAADTFRAAAIEQLETWAQRLNVPVVTGEYKSDPSSVCFDAYQAAVTDGAKFLICDTAGRLHTRHNLMEELRKTARVLGRQDGSAPHDRLLVVDATTGSNALAQAKEFSKAIDLTGLVVTKLDGSGKGGVVVPIKRELGISPRFIGTGETAADFASFSPDAFVDKIL